MKPAKLLLFFATILVCVLGFFLPHEGESHYFWEKIPVFDAIFGFVGCLFLIIFSKTIGSKMLNKREDYYD